MLLEEEKSLGVGTYPVEMEVAEFGKFSARAMCWMVALVEGVWGAAGAPGQAGPSHHLGVGADRGKLCGNLDLGLHQPSPSLRMCAGPWQPPLESPFVPMGLISRGEISCLCKGSGPRLQE